MQQKRNLDMKNNFSNWHSLHLNKVRKNLAGDRPTLFAIFPLIFVPFAQ